MTFNQKVYFIVGQIPKGMVMNYGQIAKLCGCSRASRAVGYALNALPSGFNLPWHRVVYKDGSLAKLRQSDKQYKLLKLEEIGFSEDKKVNMKNYQWNAEEIEALWF